MDYSSSALPFLITSGSAAVPASPSGVTAAGATSSIIRGAKTPATIIKRLHAELVQFRKSAGATERFSGAGVEVVASSPAELATAMASEMIRMGKLIKDARLRTQ